MMDFKGEQSTYRQIISGVQYRQISGVQHRLQYPPAHLSTLSRKELYKEVRALVRIINSGRLHNEKQKQLIASLESRLAKPQATEKWPPPIPLQEVIDPAAEARVIEVTSDTSPIPQEPRLG